MYFVRLLKNDYDFQKEKNTEWKLEKNYKVILEYYEPFTAKVATILAAN